MSDHERVHENDLAMVSDRLARAGRDVPAVLAGIARFSVAIPTWALAAGGTRFGRFAVAGEPRDINEKLEDAAIVKQLTASANRVSLHFPWDEQPDMSEVRRAVNELGLGVDAVNSNTFQDQPDQPLSYALGSFSNTSPRVRKQAVEHHLHVIEMGSVLGADALTVWLADGSNYPGQMSLRGSFERVLDCLREVYVALPTGWRLFTEHKPYEPAFYATVVQDWGSSLLLAQQLGQQAQCLVDLGHHLPNTNIELVVARLLGCGKLGGFHFNDSKYGDDDLTAGSIKPYGLFLIFHELVQAERERLTGFNPSYMIDQSHIAKDPIEAMLQTVDQLQIAYCKALLVNQERLAQCQESGDVLMAERELKDAFETDVRPLVAEARRRQGGAIDPVATFRHMGYRARVAADRGGVTVARSGGI